MHMTHSALANLAAIFILSTVPGHACQTYNAAQIANAVSSSPNASSAVQSTSCTWGGAAAAESGGKTCASNGSNFGVLQLNSANVAAAGYTPSQYMALPLQQQVDVWLQQAGPTKQGSAFDSINNNVGQNVNGVTMSQGMAAACSQFGSGICKNDLNAIRSGGACPSTANGGVLATRATLANGTANLDGNGQSICSWGNVINQKIASSGCVNGKGSGCVPGNNGDFSAPPSTQVSSSV